MADQAAEKNEGRFRIFHRILLTMILISLIPLGGLWYISIYKAKADASKIVADNLGSTTQALANRVEDWLDMNLRLLSQNGSSAAILSMDEARQNPLLKTITNTYQWIYLAFTIQPDGKNIGRSDGKPQTDYGDRAYFKQVMSGNPVGQQVLIGRTSGRPALVLAKPADTADNIRKGIIAIAMGLEELSDTVVSTRVGQTGYATLLDDRNRLIAIGDGSVSAELQDLSDHPALAGGNRPGEPILFEEGGKRILAFSKEIDLGWRLVVQQEYNEAYAVAKATQRNAVILLALTLAVVFLVATLLAAGLSRPIRSLTDIADRISRGELDVDIREKNRGDEIGALARAIERMGVSLDMAFKRLRKKS